MVADIPSKPLRLPANGQVVIPRRMREQLGWTEGTELVPELREGAVFIRAAAADDERTTRLSPNGQFVLPLPMRTKLGWEPQQFLLSELADDGVLFRSLSIP